MSEVIKTYGEQTLHMMDMAFQPVLEDADQVLQRLLRNMMDKNSKEGTLTIRVDLSLVTDSGPNFDPEIEGDTRNILVPRVSHKVSSMMQLRDEAKGATMYDGYELVWDEEKGEYVMRSVPVSQQTIFDADFRPAPDEEPEERQPALLTESGTGRTESNGTALNPFAFLMKFAGQELRVYEALGYYTVRSERQTVVLSSAYNPAHRLYCSADKLHSHVGHTAGCVPQGEGGNAAIFLVCKDCGEVLFSASASDERNAAPDGDPDDEGVGDAGEAEDMSDAFGEYPYDQPAL